MVESEELKSLLIKVKEESGKSWFKAQHSENKDHGIRSHYFMANGGKNETMVDFIFFYFIIMADTCHEAFLLARKAMAKLLKIRDIHQLCQHINN